MVLMFGRVGRLAMVLGLVLAATGAGVGVVSASVTTRVSTLAVAAPACVRAVDHGAVPDDGLDDRDALQRAITAAQDGPGCLELAAGRFHATRRPGGSDSIGSLRITEPLTVRGAGVGVGVTVLAMLGSGTCPGCSAPQDWILVEIAGGASGVAVSDLSLDGSQRSNTGEQTHLLQLTGPTRDVLVERLAFTLPTMGASTGGDCVRLLGALGTAPALVVNTTIRDVVGLDCDRSFVSLQRGVQGLVVERGESVRVGDQAIDFEPTGGTGCETLVRDVQLRRLTLRTGRSSGATVTVAGKGCKVVRGVTLTDSVVEDGGVFVLNAHDVTLSRLHLRSVPGSAQAPVLARERIVNLRVLDSVVERVAASGPGAAVRVSGQDTARPTDVLLSGVRVPSATPEPLIHTTNLARLSIVDAELVHRGAPVANAAVHVSAVPATPAESPTLTDTAVCGALAGVITTAGQVGQPVLVRVTGPSDCP
ncbi:hypothetical protein [Actinophytocola xanthii]|uniref:Pectate lyase superfamily protein domain-containing protein n=1 Tax=Actinophytocola xanthii TaxID=1912961 RepID=A0A1Q8C922_9PSEU|nr:hypothetical protein [Actinophytocola xanthii]OLF10835.1 hypothetical protein BU204_30995 [Actinophytocola xanthii]